MSRPKKIRLRRLLRHRQGQRWHRILRARRGVRRVRGMAQSPRPELDGIGKVMSMHWQLSLTNASLLQVTSRPLISEHGPLVTGALRTDEIAVQSLLSPPPLAHILSLLCRHLRPERRGHRYLPIPKMELRFSRPRTIIGGGFY